MNISRLELYHYPATRSARVKWVLHETVGDDFETIRVDLYGGDQYKPDFTALNPNHCVPLLKIEWADGGVTNMTESAAMVALFADAFPQAGLAPPAADMSPARADYLRMMHFAASPMDMMLWQVRCHEHLLATADSDQRTIDRCRQKFADEVEPQLLARLDASAFICGDAFTAADILVGHNVSWARAYGLCQHDAFRGYLSRLAKRPAFLKAFADAREFSVAPPAAAREARVFKV
ncbi:MAG: glutathione S-transferase family protein [Alphaproteobacteria bacterium]|nr:MAG: glutathione S-transferase family protein [Alphaproteobacteria bacterium]